MNQKLKNSLNRSIYINSLAGEDYGNIISIRGDSYVLTAGHVIAKIIHAI